VKRFEWIEDHLKHWPVQMMCRVLGVRSSGYYAWVKRPASERKERHMKQIEKIREIHQASNCTYGSPRVHEQLLIQGERISLNTVAKRMQKAEICVKPAKAFVPRTTISDPTHQVFENVLDRDFKATLPNQKWACDITYIPTSEGWLYLAVVIDLCSRKIVGWSMRDDLKSELASEALAMALQQRKPSKGLLHHSDRGVQYTSEDYQSLLCESGIEVSMSGVGQCWDNAVAESFFGTLKQERVNRVVYATRQEARVNIFQWMQGWYNRKRLHSSLGYQSPEQFEASLN
jgi:putative transposase